MLPESPSKNAVPSCAEYGVVGVSTGLIGILQVNEIIKIVIKKGEILDGKILIFDLFNMKMKKLNLKSDEVNKKIKNFAQFMEFYSEDECSEKNNKIDKINALDFNCLYKTKPNKILLIDVREYEEFSTSSIEGSISIPLSHLKQHSDLQIIQKDFISECCDENETLEIIKKYFDKNNIILDPHTAVGVGAANKLNFSDCVVLSTAHPCKFPAATDKAINKHEELPKELQYVHSKEENFQLLKNDTDEVKNFVKSKL